MSEIIKETIDTTGKFVEVEEKESLFEKGKKVGSKVCTYGKKTLDYVKENPVDSVIKVGAVLTAVVSIITAVKAINKTGTEGKTVYSEATGESVVLKKKLNNDNKVELDYRMKTGQTKIEALNEMGLIK